MKGVQCYEIFGGIALKNHAFQNKNNRYLYLHLPPYLVFSCVLKPMDIEKEQMT